MFRPAAVFAALCLAAVLPATDPPAGPRFPPPKTLGPVETYGANIQRAMTLLATSTPQKRNTVRVLFYGQSITEQEWTWVVADDLKARFPHANLVLENRAIGGFTANFLVRTAEADLYPAYPDLVIFHVYGSPVDYEAIIRRLRERTTADILHATDHLSTLLGDTVDEETDPAKLTPAKQFQWMNHVVLPGLARKYRTELADVRGLWKRYLTDHGLAPDDLLADRIHLNAHGNYLMGEVMRAHLRHRPELTDTAWKDRVKTLAVGTDVTWKGGKLVVPFDGNRVDVVCKHGLAAPAAVRIDGKKPSAFPELYLATRAFAASPRCATVPVLRVQAEAPRVLEEWTLTTTEISPDRKRFKYRVAGTVTGDDGEGDTTKRFVSKSGRVAFDPEDFNLAIALSTSRDPAAAAFVIRWSVVPLFVDHFISPGVADPAVETTVTLAQGLPNGRHTLEIDGTPDTPIAAVRVYRPALPTE